MALTKKMHEMRQIHVNFTCYFSNDDFNQTLAAWLPTLPQTTVTVTFLISSGGVPWRGFDMVQCNRGWCL